MDLLLDVSKSDAGGPNGSRVDSSAAGLPSLDSEDGAQWDTLLDYAKCPLSPCACLTSSLCASRRQPLPPLTLCLSSRLLRVHRYGSTASDASSTGKTVRPNGLSRAGPNS